MSDEMRVTFEEIVKQNERRIHHQLHNLNINDPHKEYFQEGLCAMWNAYETYQPDKGPMATYFNYTIRNRLIDLIRKQTRVKKQTTDFIAEGIIHIDDGNSLKSNDIAYPIVNFSELLRDDPYLWKNLKFKLTENQWKWIEFYIIRDLLVKDIAIQENTSEEAVKSWGKQVRKKLRDVDFRKSISWDV